MFVVQKAQLNISKAWNDNLREENKKISKNKGSNFNGSKSETRIICNKYTIIKKR